MASKQTTTQRQLPPRSVGRQERDSGPAISSGKPCPIANCDGFISLRSKLDTCPKCRANILGWDRSPVHRIRTRRRNLARYVDRMGHVVKGQE